MFHLTGHMGDSVLALNNEGIEKISPCKGI